MLDDVEAAFANLSNRSEALTARMNGLIQSPAYRSSFGNGFGFSNHFQGIQRAGRYLMLSGADAHGPAADLFVVRLDGTHAGTLVAALTLDDQAWHAGGIAIHGTTLALPLYGTSADDDEARPGLVRFYDVAEPERPVQLPVTIERPARKAIAVALTRLQNAHWLVAVLSGRDGQPRRLDFYLSRTADLESGFGTPLSWQTAFVRARNRQAPSFSHFQNINFLPQADGRLYLVGFHNTFLNVTALPGRDYADLYEVILPASVTRADTPSLDYPAVVKVANRRLRCEAGQCSFDAAAGAWIDPGSGTLSIYATPGWIDGDSLKVARYSAK